MATIQDDGSATIAKYGISEPSVFNDSSAENDIEDGRQKDEVKACDIIDWNDDPHNPMNWPAWKKTLQVMMLSSTALLAYVAPFPDQPLPGLDQKLTKIFRSLGTSIMSPAHSQLMEEFNASSTVAILPLSMYAIALGFGPVIGGPLSETMGRFPVYLSSVPLGAVFTLGAGFSHSIGAVCFLRFMAGLCWSPVLAVASGSLSETFTQKTRGPVSALFILMPFLGPGLG